MKFENEFHIRSIEDYPVREGDNFIIIGVGVEKTISGLFYARVFCWNETTQRGFSLGSKNFGQFSGFQLSDALNDVEFINKLGYKHFIVNEINVLVEEGNVLKSIHIEFSNI